MVTIPVRHCPPAGTCEIHIAAGTLATVAPRVRAIAANRALALVTDSHVAPLFGDRLRDELAARAPRALEPRALVYAVLPAGEQHKTRAQKEALEDRWLAAGLGRDTVAIALGGGVVTDLVGFTAATYLRGIPYVSLPTTLIGQVDAAIGGKTAVDTPAGKNLIGAFHPPLAVFIDPQTLASLPEREYRGGLAEVVKHAVIRDAALFEQLEAEAGAVCVREPALLEDIVARNVAIKAAVVNEDEHESGLRQILNCGHTIGHAIELLRNYEENHGYCVGIGLVVEAHLARVVGVATADLAARVAVLLKRFGLPTTVPADLTDGAIIAATGSDKKRRGGKVRYALPAGLGRMHPGDGSWSLPVDDAAVAQAIAMSRGR